MSLEISHPTLPSAQEMINAT